MADTAQPPQHIDAQASTPPAHREVVSDRVETVAVRRSPKYGVFLALGAALGVLAAMILTFAFDGNDFAADNGAVYTDGQVFGFLALVGIAVGLIVGGVVAIILDRVVGRRTKQVEVAHETVETVD
ncbi:MAG: potassium transporter Trk [Microbacterium sp.]|uniref:potassium transporter Trk n=1 Tax=Microbacterium sp. TaxID=51671 RepID=UPI003A86F68A